MKFSVLWTMLAFVFLAGSEVFESLFIWASERAHGAELREAGFE